MRGRSPPELRLASLPDAVVRSIAAPGRTSFNPSIASGDRGFLCTIRTLNGHPDSDGDIGGSPDNRLQGDWIARLDASLNVLDMQPVDLSFLAKGDAGQMYDSRPFRWNGGWWLATTWTFDASPDRCQMMLCRLEGAKIVEQHFLPSPMHVALEKNWMPLVRGERLEWIYWVDPMEVVAYLGGSGLSHRRVARWRRLDDWRGSSQCVRYGSNWLCVVHLRTHVRRSVYMHRLVEFTDDFQIRRVSEPFMFEIDGIEFCAGLCLTDTDAILSYGVRDCEARLIRLPLSRVESMLQPFRPHPPAMAAWLSVRASLRPLTHNPWIRHPRKQLRAALARRGNPESR
jgi:hypothetical protein